MAEHQISLDEVSALVRERIRVVMALEVDVAPDARFDEDLHADSLDLVEVIEGVERDLARRGIVVALGDDELLGLRTVDEAAHRIHAGTRERGGA